MSLSQNRDLSEVLAFFLGLNGKLVTNQGIGCPDSAQTHPKLWI
jgi:hypothetical protein